MTSPEVEFVVDGHGVGDIMNETYDWDLHRSSYLEETFSPLDDISS